MIELYSGFETSEATVTEESGLTGFYDNIIAHWIITFWVSCPVLS